MAGHADGDPLIQPGDGAPSFTAGSPTRRRWHEGIGPYLQLMRPANLPTAAADVLAGFAVAGGSDFRLLLFLCLASVALYAGGVTLNDAFDARLDARERPERPISSGRIALRVAVVQGIVLLAFGISSAFMAGPLSGTLALVLALLIVAYDAWGKHRPLIGPLNMGLCRGLNLLLGLSASPLLLGQHWFLMLLPIGYIAAITAVSRGEVHGGSRTTGRAAIGLLVAVIGGLVAAMTAQSSRGLLALPFVLYFAWRVVPAFYRASESPQAEHIRAAVKAGVLSVVALDAALGAAYAGPIAGGIILTLLPVSGWLAKTYSVT